MNEPTKDILDRMALIAKLATMFPGMTIDARTIRAYAEQLRNFPIHSVELACGEVAQDCDRFPSLARIIKGARKIKSETGDGREKPGTWGKQRPVMWPDEARKLEAAEWGWMHALADVYWRIFRGAKQTDQESSTSMTISENECYRYGLDIFGQPLWLDLPLPQTHWETAQKLRNYRNAIMSRTGQAIPQMEAM